MLALAIDIPAGFGLGYAGYKGIVEPIQSNQQTIGELITSNIETQEQITSLKEENQALKAAIATIRGNLAQLQADLNREEDQNSADEFGSDDSKDDDEGSENNRPNVELVSKADLQIGVSYMIPPGAEFVYIDEESGEIKGPVDVSEFIQEGAMFRIYENKGLDGYASASIVFENGGTVEVKIAVQLASLPNTLEVPNDWGFPLGEIDVDPNYKSPDYQELADWIAENIKVDNQGYDIVVSFPDYTFEELEKKLRIYNNQLLAVEINGVSVAWYDMKLGQIVDSSRGFFSLERWLAENQANFMSAGKIQVSFGYAGQTNRGDAIAFIKLSIQKPIVSFFAQAQQ